MAHARRRATRKSKKRRYRFGSNGDRMGRLLQQARRATRMRRRSLKRGLL